MFAATRHYAPERERCIRWDDPQLAIHWPLGGTPQLSAKDLKGVPYAEIELFP